MSSVHSVAFILQSNVRVFGVVFFLMTNKHDWYTFTIVNEHSIYIIYDIDLDAWP